MIGVVILKRSSIRLALIRDVFTIVWQLSAVAANEDRLVGKTYFGNTLR